MKQKEKKGASKGGSVPASAWPQEVGRGTALQLCQESPWRQSTGLFMINTPRQLSSRSLLKYTQYYLNTMIFRAERSRWDMGEDSGPVTRAVAGAGFLPFPEEKVDCLHAIPPWLSLLSGCRASPARCCSSITISRALAAPGIRLCSVNTW